VVELKPEWPKGHSRVGAALHGLRRYDAALDAYEKGLELDPENAQLKQGMTDALAAQGAGSRGGGGGLFTSPDVLSRLATDPRTRGLLGQPDFMQILADVNANPNSMQRYLADDRFQLAMEVGLGLSFGAPPGAGGPAAGRPGAPPPRAPAPAPEPEPVPEPEPEQDEAAQAAAAAKAEAQAAKEAGNAAYKAKDFAAAIEHYNRAIALDDTDVSFLTNRAAVKYEQGDLAGAVADCDAAVARGREVRADYKLVARALTRKGNALAKGGDLEGAIEAYNRSLTEHRAADTLKRLQEAEKALKEAKEEAYVDMEASAVEKDAGNAAFKAQRYPEAVQHYSEALRRGPPAVNPEAHKLFSNRAACYTKLGAWAEGLKDAEECIRLAPDFSKGYSRKGHLQFFMKEFDQAMATYEAGLERDPESAELKEGLVRCVQAINKVRGGIGAGGWGLGAGGCCAARAARPAHAMPSGRALRPARHTILFSFFCTAPGRPSNLNPRPRHPVSSYPIVCPLPSPPLPRLRR
jgi:stress-induced-phosphoprotein 1